MKSLYKIIRSLLVTVIVLAFVIPVGVYVALSLPEVQRRICRTAEKELSRLLDVPVGIDDVIISPFNRVSLRRVVVSDTQGDTIASISRLGAGIRLFDLVVRRRLVVNYVEIIGLDGRISRDSIGAPLNIQPIIDALSPKDKSQPPKHFDFAINTVVIRKSSLSYDVASAPQIDGRFDENHISLSDIRADLRLPRMTNDDFTISLRRLAFAERSGFTLKGLEGMFHITATETTIDNLGIELPNSSLAFNNIAIPYSSLANIRNELSEMPVNLSVLPGSYITIKDMAAFAPVLKDLDARIKTRIELSGTPDNLIIESLNLSTDDDYIWILLKGSVAGLMRGRESINADLTEISLGGYGHDIAEIIGIISPMSERDERILGNAGHFNFLGRLKGDINSGKFTGALSCAPGETDIEVSYRKEKNGYNFTGEVQTSDFQCPVLFNGISGGVRDLGAVSSLIDFDIATSQGNGNYVSGNINVSIPGAEWRGHRYNDITANLTVDGNRYVGELKIDDPEAYLSVTASVDLTRNEKSLQLDAEARNVDLNSLRLINRFPDHLLNFKGTASLSGSTVDDVSGTIRFDNILFADESANGLSIDSISLTAFGDSLKRHILLTSPVVDASIDGNYALRALIPSLKSAASQIFPALIPSVNDIRSSKSSEKPGSNDFNIHVTVKDSRQLEHLATLPVRVIYPINITGHVNDRSIKLNFDAPYLQQKDRLIENTSIMIAANGGDSIALPAASVYFSTAYPTKKGVMTLALNAQGQNNRIDSELQWKVDRSRDFHGRIDLTTAFSRDETEGLDTRIFLNPSELVFNDTVWEVQPSQINITHDKITIKDFKVGRSAQYIALDGVASKDSTDNVTLVLQDVNLDYIFETLDIGNAMFGGNATGTFHAASVLSPNPVLYTDGLKVMNLSYNHSLMGNATILSQWDASDKAITIDAVIDQPNGCKSKIDGAIKPLADSLDFRFSADKIQVGFMRPFMEAFTSDVSGFASGTARLWGSFKYIDMVGDIYAEDLKMKLDFTNTYYYATDSIRLTPGRIDINDITIRDQYGHSAKVNGVVTHEFFKKPCFTFNITDARDLLVYDVKENLETNWYGRIFGNGSATVSGIPGEININVSMSTAPQSTFTFVLSDAEQADEYTFITFRDRDQAVKDSIAASDATPRIVKELKEKIAQSDDGGEPSVYKMNIAVDVNPSAQVILVMDPIGGDRIRANGSGNLRMTYDSANEDLRMFGTYTLTRGSYNFTLQDIIIKDFTIKDGSSITFHGDPYAAQLDIEAIYSVNANLSDLDESFLNDKELNRTNVPVHALLKVTGDMRQPDINFDLEFPTLTQDTYRKVRSIVSTEEMMNRQIIYLLALNRFYTPDYMNTTKGNELVSVASSTISSQLSSILGQLSDNWSIAPNFRSDRGDFSDVEVDLALSSHLLNNRLLLNGNFGYRDKSLNNNSFIGDFDIEYLLNRSGSIRLKAYNRYNDQNYYLKSALTTQGVGVVFKRDFDDIFSFLRPLRKDHHETSDSVTVPTDTVAIDSINLP